MGSGRYYDLYLFLKTLLAPILVVHLKLILRIVGSISEKIKFLSIHIGKRGSH